VSRAPAVLDARRLERLGVEPAWSRTLPVLLADGERVRVHALDASPPGREPPLTVVCLHGNPTWSVMWRSFHQRLGDRYRVLAVDQVSMGLSERTGPRVYAQRVDDLGRLTDALGVTGSGLNGPVVTVAHDWGGIISLGWAAEHRDQAPPELAVDETLPALAGSFHFPLKYGYAAVGRVEQLGPAVPVIDSADFLRSPESYLRWLCDYAGVPFTDAMLSWPAGPRESDGV